MSRLTAFLVCLIGMYSTVHAGVIEMDLSTPGDGLLTYDTINRRAWLDLTETGGLELSEVLAQMEPGGRLSGFQFAMLEDVTALAASAGVGWTTPWILPFNPEPHVHEFVELLEPILIFSGGILPETSIALGQIASNAAINHLQFNDTNFFVLSMYDEPLYPGTINHPLYGNPTP